LIKRFGRTTEPRSERPQLSNESDRDDEIKPRTLTRLARSTIKPAIKPAKKPMKKPMKSR